MQFPEVVGWYPEGWSFVYPQKRYRRDQELDFLVHYAGTSFPKLLVSLTGSRLTWKKGVGEDHNLSFALVLSLLKEFFRKSEMLSVGSCPFAEAQLWKWIVAYQYLPPAFPKHLTELDRTHCSSKMGQRSSTGAFFPILIVHIVISSVSILGIVCSA